MHDQPLSVVCLLDFATCHFLPSTPVATRRARQNSRSFVAHDFWHEFCPPLGSPAGVSATRHGAIQLGGAHNSRGAAWSSTRALFSQRFSSSWSLWPLAPPPRLRSSGASWTPGNSAGPPDTPTPASSPSCTAEASG